MVRRMAVHFWPVFDGHFVGYFFHKKLNSSISGVTSSPRMEQFSESASRLKWNIIGYNIWMALQLIAGCCRPCKRHAVLTGEMIEQVARLIGRDKLHGSLRQNFRLDNILKHFKRQVAAEWRRFDDGWHARDKRRSQFFEHSPDRKVERVNLNRHTP